MQPRIFNLMEFEDRGKGIYRELAGTSIGDLLHSSKAFLPEARAERGEFPLTRLRARTQADRVTRRITMQKLDS
jgi:hypothetical protein